MPSIADRVKETTSTTGTGTITLGGAVAGFQSFLSAFPSGAVVYYEVDDGTNWEVGIGTFSGSTLTRDTILSNSAGTTTPVTLGGSAKTVICTAPTEFLDEMGINVAAKANMFMQ